MLLHTKVDLVVTLGGDGTVLWVRLSLAGVSSCCSRYYNQHCRQHIELINCYELYVFNLFLIWHLIAGSINV